MKTSKATVAENRIRILDAAGRLFRARGLDGVSVAEVMREAGLTHGAFYSYFESKEKLVDEMCSHVLARPILPEGELARAAESYLGDWHRSHPEAGCLFAALGSEMARAGPEVRSRLTAGTAEQLSLLTANAPGETLDERRQAAVASWAAMLGALMLSRIVDDAALSDEILTRTRSFITGEANAPK